jgi:hypothetical protein
MRFRQFYGLVLIFVLLAGYMFIQISNGRFNMVDFQVYYLAAERLAEGQNLYQITSDGHYIFKYSAVSAIYFLPLSWLPFEAAKVVHWILSSFVFCVILYLVFRMGEQTPGGLRVGTVNLLYLISFICLGAFLELEIHLGQVNLLVFLFLLFSALASSGEKYITAGILLAVSIFIKPFGLIILAYFIYRFRYREILVFLGTVVVLFLLPVFFFGSFEMLLEQNQLWFKELLTELVNEQDILTPETHTVFSVIARYTPLRWIHWSPAGTLIFQGVVLVSIGLLFILLRRGAQSASRLEIYELALLFTLVPLTLYTNRNLYLYIVLALALLLIDFNRLGVISRIAFIAGIFISCFNIIEIWGPAITTTWEGLSLISVGTIMIWIVLYIKAYRESRI